MRTIIHDLNDKDFKKMKFNKTDKIISSLKCVKRCMGCFSCWIKHPKKCAIKDDFSNIAEYLKDSDELIIISKNRYGCYSASNKMVLERCIGYVLPFFTIRNKEIHHETRYDKQLTLTLYIYGDVTEDDKISMDRLAKANAMNLNMKEYNINYIKSIEEIKLCTL